MNFILVILAKLLYLAVEPINFGYVILIKKKFNWRRLNGYFRNEALAIDRFGNSQYKSLFNAWFIKEKGYKHGNINETISSVLGKNQRDETLTKFGMLITKILDRMDENHCKESINDNV